MYFIVHSIVSALELRLSLQSDDYRNKICLAVKVTGERKGGGGGVGSKQYLLISNVQAIQCYISHTC